VNHWDSKGGLYYFQDYTLEVSIGFYRPHGWAYAENCRFESHNPSATIWHEDPGDRHAKTVLRNYTFTDNDSFKVRRFSREVQAYLVGCRSAANMADTDIYHTASGPVGTARVLRRLPPPGRHQFRLDAR